jgi:hypothetical protein
MPAVAEAPAKDLAALRSGVALPSSSGDKPMASFMGIRLHLHHLGSGLCAILAIVG